MENGISEIRREWAERQRRREAERNYETARDFALSLHSNRNLLIHKKKIEDEEELKRGEIQNEFQIIKEAIKKRRREKIFYTTSDMEVDLIMLPKKVPTLMELSVKVLAQNHEAIKSLNLVPDHLKRILSNLVSGFGKVDAHFVNLLVNDSPSEVYVKNCAELDEDDLIKILCDCDSVSLKVLVLDLCGRAMNDTTITEFLKRSPKGFVSLTKLSLQGAFSLTDNGLDLITTSSPLLRFINLSECSLLTSDALRILAEKFGSTLRGLSIGGCLGMQQYTLFFASLFQLKKLIYLSVAGYNSITEILVKIFFTWNASNLTDLSLASCNGVTDECIRHIGEHCKKLEALDISDLHNLTDKSLEYIAEGCKSLKSVILTKNRFSDVGIAAFLEVLGGSLNQLCLNKVRDVGPDTAISLTKCCQMQYLDLSWCRGLTEEDLRRILCCCSSLTSIKLFGWTQVKDTFLEEVSNSHIHITGLKMTSLYPHFDDSYPRFGAKFF